MIGDAQPKCLVPQVPIWITGCDFNFRTPGEPSHEVGDVYLRTATLRSSNQIQNLHPRRSAHNRDRSGSNSPERYDLVVRNGFGILTQSRVSLKLTRYKTLVSVNVPNTSRN